MSDAQDAYMMMYRTLNSGGVTGPSTYPEAVAAIGTPVLWYKFQGTSGTVAANSGSLGSGWDGTFSTTFYGLGNAGQIGANEAIKSKLGFNSVAKAGATPTDTLSALTFARLVYYPSLPGTPTANQITSTDSSQRALFTDNTSGTMQFTVIIGGVNSDKLTTDTFPTIRWFWVFGRWDGATGVTDIKWGYNSVLNSPALSTNTSAGVGTMDITQVSFQAQRTNALIDEIIVWDTVATDEQLLDIVTLSGL